MVLLSVQGLFQRMGAPWVCFFPLFSPLLIFCYAAIWSFSECPVIVLWCENTLQVWRFFLFHPFFTPRVTWQIFFLSFFPSCFLSFFLSWDVRARYKFMYVYILIFKYTTKPGGGKKTGNLPWDFCPLIKHAGKKPWKGLVLAFSCALSLSFSFFVFRARPLSRFLCRTLSFSRALYLFLISCISLDTTKVKKVCHTHKSASHAQE